MNYHPDDFLNLIEEVENQGGVHLSGEICKGHVLRMNLPLDEDDPSGPKVNKKVITTGCNRRAKFMVPLLPEAYFDDEWYTHPDFDFNDGSNPTALMSDGESFALVKACAVDDAMGLWPRFNGAMTTGESFETPVG
jgi:hypothetical protein